MARNIRDIAKSAGVSVATVSKVINNYPNVSPETKRRVLDIIREEQFIPNSTARGLVKGRSMTLGMFLTTGLTHPFFVNLMVGMESALKDTGYDLIYLAQIDWNPEYSLVRHCLSRNVEGVIIFGFQRDDLNFEEMLQSGIPTIFIDMDMTGPRAGFVTSDNIDGVKKAVRYLTGLEHRRIAFISGLLDSYVGKLRLEGYRQALREEGLPDLQDYIATGDFTKESGYQAMQTFLQLAEPPTAVVCSSDMSALGVMEAAKEAGLSIPDDLSVMGFDDIELAQHLQPPLSTIRQDCSTIGSQAVRMLHELIHHPDFSPPELVVPTELIVRHSCGPCRK
ncbi:LacI family DNA-binding transcriptional regulator [Paenibacillus sp. YYML68]|uniref:LacI family DNA-binding transcriptional regulator n=1 Tax=Paenibacillus sp. YYML68 TaxID=2909250 RepID=UPI0024914430|nr:LacI family DNA-binding transcriptional regulator [Paenibacillus sp. YYML68]